MAATQQSVVDQGILARFKQFGLHPFSHILAAGKNRRNYVEQAEQKAFESTFRLRVAGTSYSMIAVRKTG